MSPNGEPASGAGDFGDRLSLETSLLRTLCLTVNATGSEIKYKITDTLSEDDFFFPVNKSLYAALSEMHRRGDYVVYTNLEEELRHQSVDIPEDLYIEDFFQGSIPDLSEVGNWVNRLKEWSRSPFISTGPSSMKEAPAKTIVNQTPSKSVKPASSPEVSATRVRSTSEVRELSRKPEQTPPPAAAQLEKKAPQSPQAQQNTLASEGDEWVDYLDDLASRQGKSFETGFTGLDEDAGGVTTGVMLLIDQELDRRSSFLKQLTDQVAMRSKVPCLFLSFDTLKAVLRVRTLSRLSGVTAKDIEKGRLKKDSQEWESVEHNGRKAAGWLKRVFVVESGKNTDLDAVRKLGRQLVKGSQDSTGLIVIDNLEKLAQGSSSRDIIRELKEISDSLNVLVVAATADRKVMAEAGVDFTGEMAGGETGVRLEFTPKGELEATTVRLKFQMAIHKFTEQ